MNIFGNSTLASTTTNSGGAFGGFGGFKPAGGNIGNPVGYGFGISSKMSDTVTASNATSVFDPFGLSAEKKLDSDVDDSAESGQSLGSEMTGSKAQTPEVNNNSELLASKNQHDEEGEGEEDEDTVHSVKLKAYRMRKADEQGGAGWVELGYGKVPFIITSDLDYSQTGYRGFQVEKA
jgi:nucleoporin NUP2